MNKGWIVWIALVIVIAVVAYAYTGFKISRHVTKTTALTTITVTNTPVSSSSTTTVPGVRVNCAALYIQGVRPYSSTNESCQWEGGKLGVWVLAGSAYNATVSIVGTDGITYIQGGFNYNATTFFSNVTLPKQNYTVTLSAGSESGVGLPPFIKLNTTTTPPALTYSYIYNANFSDGKYTGWNASGSGFGKAPLNITYANSAAINCYQGTPWVNYIGGFFATTFTCGTSVSPGNLTSEPFRVNPKTPFLNFRIISPSDSLIYVQILQVNGQNQTSAIVAHFNTYNISLNANVNSQFQNVSIPLTTLTNKVVRIRVVASTVQPQRYMAVGDFSLGSLPNTQRGVGIQINITK
jgi:hypothetical protein